MLNYAAPITKPLISQGCIQLSALV